MPGLVPGIHVLLGLAKKQDVDGRDKPGNDELCLRCAADALGVLLERDFDV
jgi:hypothetical protein